MRNLIPHRPRILVAGIGNIFLGDDAFGVEVAHRFARLPLPRDVRVVDFGIRGLDLAYALLDPYDAVVLVDAMPRGQRPGTLYLLEAARPEPDENAGWDNHRLDPVAVLALAARMGGPPQRVFVLGCEPSAHSEDDFVAGLSPPVAAAIEPAVARLNALIGDCLGPAIGRTLESTCAISTPEARS